MPHYFGIKLRTNPINTGSNLLCLCCFVNQKTGEIMTVRSFQEYLDSKGKLGKPVIDLTGDQVDPKKSPAQPPKGKPYIGKKGSKSEKPFGDQGDTALKYEPNVKDNKCKVAKIPTVEQYEIANFVASKVSEDPTILENLIRQIKNTGYFPALVAEVLEHKDAFKCISEVMSHKEYGPQFCNKLVRAISEEVATPFSDQLDGEEEEDEQDALDNQDQGDGEGVDDVPSDDEMPPDELNQDPNMGAENPNGGPLAIDPMMTSENPTMQNNPAMQNLQQAFAKKMMSKYAR